MKIFVAVLLIAVGSMGLQAQNGRGKGTGTCGVCIGNCVNSSLLTDEQKATLTDLCTTFQSEMNTLRTQLVAATTWAEKAAIRQDMNSLRTAHQTEVKNLLSSWGITLSTGGKRNATATGVCNGTGTGKQSGNQYRGRR